MMKRVYASRTRRCLLATAVAQALIAGPVLAQSAPVDQDMSATQATTDSQASSNPKKAEANKSKSPLTLQTVVVTAQRRNQDLQDVPISVSAMDVAELQARGITNVADLSAAAPSIVVMSGTGGNPTTAQIAIRGSFAGNPAMYWDSPVGIYLNGAYISKAQGSVFNLPDLERIEVLRGPQGTLYGRNTMAGAVNLITRTPTGVFGGTASVGFGNYNSKVGRVVLDLPAMGKLNASFGGRIERRDGWVKNMGPGPTPSLGKLDDKDAFVALHLDATDNLAFDYRYDYSKADDTPYFNQAIHSDVEQIFHIPGIAVNQDRQTTANINYPVFETMRVDNNALTVTWKPGDVSTFKYIGANREMHWDDGLDLDGSPIPFAQSNAYSRYRQTSHELQYLGNVGRWNWVTGLYYFEDSGFTDNPQSYFMGAANYAGNYGFGTRSRAAYGQVDYNLTDKLTLTAGLRRTVESKNVSRFQAINGYPLVPAGTAAEASFSATTPTLNVSYQFNPDHMVYVRYAKGYLSGGFNAEASSTAEVIRPFLPQTAQTYELGTKNTFWGGRASLNADVFYNRVNNLQSIVFTAKQSTSSDVRNVGHSHNQGLELEAQVRALENLDLRMTYSYMLGSFDKFMQLGVNVADNRAVALLPRNMLSLTADATLLRTSRGVLRGTLDYRFTDGYYRYSYQKSMVDPGTAIAANSWIRGYATINGQLSFTGMPWTSRVDGEISLWVHNLTNVAHIDNIIDFGPNFGNLRTANWNMPRTFGINFTARW